ncbi:unnamed protein product [Schistosoma mattheei]|uniref:Uncharacterized protein n=1 Tax=Schistosoma mattheei TaxID=31246 RepID=A0AA85BU25_9TREM|nr:unnamed protein product [Schistosoma mattheei]
MNIVKKEQSYYYKTYSPSLITSTNDLNSKTIFPSEINTVSSKSFGKSMIDISKIDDKIKMEKLCFDYTKDGPFWTDIHEELEQQQQNNHQLSSASSSCTLTSRETIGNLNYYNSHNQNCDTYIEKEINSHLLLNTQDICNSKKMNKLDNNISSMSEITRSRTTTMSTTMTTVIATTTTITTTGMKSIQPYKWLQIKRQQPRQNITNNSKYAINVILSKVYIQYDN